MNQALAPQVRRRKTAVRQITLRLLAMAVAWLAAAHVYAQSGGQMMSEINLVDSKGNLIERAQEITDQFQEVVRQFDSTVLPEFARIARSRPGTVAATMQKDKSIIGDGRIHPARTTDGQEQLRVGFYMQPPELGFSQLRAKFGQPDRELKTTTGTEYAIYGRALLMQARGAEKPVVFVFNPTDSDSRAPQSNSSQSEPAQSKTPNPRETGILEIDVPPDTNVTINGIDHGTTTKFSFSPIQSGRRFEYAVKVRFSNGGQASRSVSIRAGETTRLTLRPDDLFDLLDQRLIEIRTTGVGIQNVKAEVRRKSDRVKSVFIPVGTFFVSRNSAAQNMVATESLSADLPDDTWQSVWVSAACANRVRKIPGANDSFEVRRSPNQEELVRVAAKIDQSGNSGFGFARAAVPFSARQAAVWIITDNATYSDLGILTVNGVRRAIDAADAAAAMKLCDDAGIDITRKAIWRDRQQILNELSDGELKSWLSQKR